MLLTGPMGEVDSLSAFLVIFYIEYMMLITFLSTFLYVILALLSVL